jgi:hypothetical protein
MSGADVASHIMDIQILQGMDVVARRRTAVHRVR